MEISGQRKRRIPAEKAVSAEQWGTLFRRGEANAEWMTEPVIRRICPLLPSPESSMNREMQEMKPPLTEPTALRLQSCAHLLFKASWCELEKP